MEGLSNIPQGAGQQQSNEEQEARKAQEEQMRRDVIATVLEPEARERCKCILRARIRTDI
jgi:programmed cell death protein 5